MRAFLITLLLVFCFPAFASAQSFSYLLAPQSVCSGQTSQDNAKKMSATFRCMINFARKKTGAKALTSSTKLTKASEQKARDIAKCSFSHTACGREAFYYSKKSGYIKQCASWGLGENLAFGQGTLGTPRSLMLAWMQSDGHRHNLLNKTFTNQGVGVYKKGNTWYAVSEFGQCKH